MTLGEDGCQVRTGTAAPVLAARNAVVPFVEEVEAASKVAALPHLAIFPLETFARLTSSPRTDN